MLSISSISKSFAGRTLFEEVTLQINRGDRLGLVGANGAGKSTLFNIVLGVEPADSGKLSFERGVTVGFLPQESAPVAGESVLEIATAVTPEFAELRRRLQAWDAAHPDDLDPHDDIHTRYNEANGYQIEAKAKEILAGLAFRQSDFDRPAKEMSGGWVMRAHLARLLVQEPDLLMLDEPTNHLDLETLLWFQQYLKTYPGAILLISHDREFLNELVGSVLEIRFSRVMRYKGNYDDYLVQREAAETQQLAAFKSQQREINRLMEFVNRFRAKNTKAAQAQSKLKQIERMDRIEAPSADEKEIRFSFPQPQRSGIKVITLKGVRHAYGNNVVYEDLHFHAERGQRTVLVGPNGAGKSTLLKLLAGVLEPQSGIRHLGHNVKSGYYSQYRIEMLHAERTVLEEALDTPQRVTEQFVRTLLGCFLFSGDDVFKKVEVLSGGEKSRLALIKLLVDPPNLLLMDEPTTHLDMASIDALVYALGQFQGTLIFISHDVYFIRELANQVVHIHSGKPTTYTGGYQYYLDKTAPISARAGLTAGGSLQPARNDDRKRMDAPTRTGGGKSKEQKRAEAEARQARSRGRKEQQQRVHDLESEIARLEARQAEIVAEMENPATYQKPGAAQQLNRELAAAQADLQKLQADWENASTRLARLEP
jgi:ATP-binding cassette subfamily F protein 3